MTAASVPAATSPRARVTPEEWAVRVDLAACYRIAAHYRMTDLIYTHISARVPGPEPHFLINAYGLMFDEITASSLVKVSLAGAIVDDPTGLGINAAGYLIHGAVHGARDDVGCVIHTHTAAGLAVAAQRHGLLPLTQHAMRFTGCLAYHDYEGIALDPDEQQRLVRDLSTCNAMILRNHGLLTCGPTIHDAFDLMFHLDRACAAQVGALAGGAEVIRPPAAVAARVAAQFARPSRQAPANAWAALRRMLDRSDPGYRE